MIWIKSPMNMCKKNLILLLEIKNGLKILLKENVLKVRKNWSWLNRKSPKVDEKNVIS